VNEKKLKLCKGENAVMKKMFLRWGFCLVLRFGTGLTQEED